jgi:ribose/xylose/arabinose/galactoside ABC-type transport system permease subunit
VSVQPSDVAIEPGSVLEREGWDWASVVRTGTVFVVVGVTWLAFALQSPFFFTGDNIKAILTQSSSVAIIAAGLTIVIIGGEIDLSIGALQALASSVSAVVIIQHGAPWYLGVLLGIAVATGAGLLNGLITWRLRIPSFIGTLAMLGVAQGFAFLVTNNAPISGFPSRYLELGTGEFYGIPIPVLIALSILTLLHIMLHRTKLGRHIFAVGGNPEYASLAGINVGRVRTGTLVISGALAGVAGIILSARLNAGAGDYGTADLLPAVAAVVIGGTSLFGGIGTVWGTAAGVVLLTSLTNGLIVINVADYWQQIAVGLIIIGAMVLDQILKKGARVRVGWFSRGPASEPPGAPADFGELVKREADPEAER